LKDPMDAYIKSVKKIPKMPVEEERAMFQQARDLQVKARQLVFCSPTTVIELLAMVEAENLEAAFHSDKIPKTFDRQAKALVKTTARSLKSKRVQTVLAKFPPVKNAYQDFFMDRLLTLCDNNQHIDPDEIIPHLRVPVKYLTALRNKILDLRFKASTIIQRVIEANLRIVPAIAFTITKRPDLVEELITVGNESMMNCANCYDPQGVSKFSTYCSFVVAQDMRQFMGDSAVKAPVSKIKIYRATFEHLVHTLGREPTMAEVAKEMGTPEKTVQSLAVSSRSTISMSKFISTEEGEADFRAVILDNSLPVDEPVESVEQTERILAKIPNEMAREILRRKLLPQTGTLPDHRTDPEIGRQAILYVIAMVVRHLGQ